MDPDANLAQIRELRKFLLTPEGQPSEGLNLALMGEFIDKAVLFAALVEAQDEWLSAGGFLPQDWAKG